MLTPAAGRMPDSGVQLLACGRCDHDDRSSFERWALSWACPCCWWCSRRAAGAGAADPPPAADARAGQNFIPTPVFSAEEDAEIIKQFKGLRVADVVDGLDKAGLQGIGAVDPAIHPLWTDLVRFPASHRRCRGHGAVCSHEPRTQQGSEDGGF